MNREVLLKTLHFIQEHDDLFLEIDPNSDFAKKYKKEIKNDELHLKPEIVDERMTEEEAGVIIEFIRDFFINELKIKIALDNLIKDTQS